MKIFCEPLHVGIIGAAPAFGRYPVDVLLGILDVTGLTVDAVLRVDLKTRVRAVVVAKNFVNARRAIALLRRIIDRQIVIDRDAVVFQRQVDRLVFLVIGV
jgi:hypothetical protein